MAKNEIHFQMREGTGKSVTRKLRKQGKIPAVVYGRGEESFPVTIAFEEFKDVIHDLRGKLLITNLVSPAGETLQAAIKEIQRHPLTEEFLNVDFQKIHPGEMLHVSVPIKTHGTPPGLKLGGILEQVRYEIDVRGPVAKLPLHIELDISSLGVGDAIRVGDVSFQEGVEVLAPAQALIVHIASPRKEKVVEVAPVEGAEEGEEAVSSEEQAKEGETAE